MVGFLPEEPERAHESSRERKCKREPCPSGVGEIGPHSLCLRSEKEVIVASDDRAERGQARSFSISRLFTNYLKSWVRLVL